MNGIDEINKKRLYYEGLKQAIALPLPEELGHDLEEIFQDEETNEAIKETIRFWKEVEGPFVNAIAFIYNNRFIIEEKDALIKTDDETPFMMPDEFFNILKTLLKATVTEFLSVLHIPSNKKAKLLECVEHNDKAGFVSVMEHADCDTTALAKLCALCKDNASTGFEMKDDDFTYYLDYMASHLHEEDGADNRKMIEALKCWQPSAELLDDDDSDEALNRYFSDYRHFLETDLATNLHYYWDWHGDFTLKERNLIDPILDNPLAKNLIAAIREEYENPKPQPTEPIVGMQQTPQIEEHQTSRSPAEVVEQKNAEKGITQNKDEKLFADKWPLPDDFFKPAYIDDGCPQDEYFPEFLKDLVQFEGQNEQLDDQYAELRKKDLETLSVKFREFINELASKNYIPNDDANKLALAHALTGRRVKSSVKKVKWSKPKTSATQNDHINSICFLIKWFYPERINSLKDSGKNEHILTVFEGLEGTKPSSSTGDNVKKSPIMIIGKSFLNGLKECAPIVNNENLDLLLKEFEKKFGKKKKSSKN